MESRRSEQVEKPEPAINVLLVHGTWGRTAPFTREGSTLRRHIEEELAPDSCAFHVVKWSGANSYRERQRAAEDLGLKIKEIRRASEFLVVIAHSHGGNVVRYAVRNSPTNARPDALVTLATPFLEARTRSFDELFIAMHLALGALLLAAVLGVYFGEIVISLVFMAIVLALAALRPLAFLAKPTGRMVARGAAQMVARLGVFSGAFAESLQSSKGGNKELTAFDRKDEALRALVAARSLIAAPLWMLGNWPIVAFLIVALIGSMIALQVGGVTPPLSTPLFDESARQSVESSSNPMTRKSMWVVTLDNWLLPRYVLRSIFLFVYGLACAGVAGFIVWVATQLTVLLVGATLLRFALGGWRSALVDAVAFWLTDVDISATPQSAAGETLEVDARSMGGAPPFAAGREHRPRPWTLRHSRVYLNPSCCRAVAEWVARTRQQRLSQRSV